VKNLTVLKAKRYGVYTCKAETNLGKAARTMVKEDISTLVVVDDSDCLLGLITRIDLMRVRYHHEDWRDQTVGKAMTTEVVTVSPMDTLDTVMALLLERHIHRVVVVRQEQSGLHPVAVLSAADILYHMARES
jgi:signal-transduction protein with cAMP-binding, CBS, and nucleotidyltransferase domain